MEDDFSAGAFFHGGETGLEVGEGEAVGNDGGDIESGLDHGGHLIPSIEHFPSVDALDGEGVKDDLVPIDADFGFGDAEEGNFPAVAHVGDEVVEGKFVAGHFHADIESFGHAEVFLDFGEGFFADVDGAGGAEFAGEFEAEGVGIGDHDVSGAGVFGDAGGHAADGTGAGDEDVFAEDGEGEGGVGGVAEGVHDGGDVFGNFGGEFPDVGVGENKVFGEGTGGVDADAFGVSAVVSATGEAVAATTAGEVSFPGDEVAYFEVGDIFPDFDDASDEFVSDDHGDWDRFLSPGVPEVDVEVGAADSGAINFDQDILATGGWLGDIGEGEAGGGVRFDECFHAILKRRVDFSQRVLPSPHI